jgi:hypothetical protein
MNVFHAKTVPYVMKMDVSNVLLLLNYKELNVLKYAIQDFWIMVISVYHAV